MIIAGMDEVGRGCWAGPLVAGVVLLPESVTYDSAAVRLGDSKKLTKKQREIADTWIRESAISYGLGWVWPAEIDAFGLTASVGLAMHRALKAISRPYDRLIIDGSINYCPENPRAETLVKADALMPAVSAASIIAKVARDNYMSSLASKYDVYQFAGHVGYGTATHMAALKQFGVSDIHRKSYKPIQELLK